MEKYKYVYKVPEEHGYTRVYLTKEQHKEVLDKRPLSWAINYEYYISKDKILVEQYASKPAIALVVLMYPIHVLMAGLGNIKELHQEYSDIFHQRERGKFLADEAWCSSDFYKRVKEMVNYEVDEEDV